MVAHYSRSAHTTEPGAGPACGHLQLPATTLPSPTSPSPITHHTTPPATRAQVGQQLKEALELPPQVKISYSVFEDKLKKGGKAPDRYAI